MWYCVQRLGLFMFFLKIEGGGKRCRGQRPRQRYAFYHFKVSKNPLSVRIRGFYLNIE
jgi:hypothetical protein